MKFEFGSGRIEIMLGDITHQHADAIVNSANAHLAVGGGVDAAIHRRGGPAILQDLRRRYPVGCQTGRAVPSVPGELNCKVLIHAVGPVWRMDEVHAPGLLERAYVAALEVAQEHECRSIAFPAISCGAYAFPLPQGAEIALQTARSWIERKAQPSDIRFVLIAETPFGAFQQAASTLFAEHAVGE